LNHRKDFVLFMRGVTRGGSVWYYSTYDSYGRRTAARSTGQTNKTLAERYCNGLMRVLHVKGSKRYRKKDRTIFVRHDLMVRIHREFKGGEYLFGWAKQAKATTLPVVRSQVVRKERRFTRSWVTMWVHRASSQLLGRAKGVHTLRHSFATLQLHEHPEALKDISEYMGHSDVSTTSIYLHGGWGAAEAKKYLFDLAPKEASA
jgi:integrase